MPETIVSGLRVCMYMCVQVHVLIQQQRSEYYYLPISEETKPKGGRPRSHNQEAVEPRREPRQSWLQTLWTQALLFTLSYCVGGVILTVF